MRDSRSRSTSTLPDAGYSRPERFLLMRRVSPTTHLPYSRFSTLVFLRSFTALTHFQFVCEHNHHSSLHRYLSGLRASGIAIKRPSAGRMTFRLTEGEVPHTDPTNRIVQRCLCSIKRSVYYFNAISCTPRFAATTLKGPDAACSFCQAPRSLRLPPLAGPIRTGRVHPSPGRGERAEGLAWRGTVWRHGGCRQAPVPPSPPRPSFLPDRASLVAGGGRGVVAWQRGGALRAAGRRRPSRSRSPARFGLLARPG